MFRTNKKISLFLLSISFFLPAITTLAASSDCLDLKYSLYTGLTDSGANGAIYRLQNFLVSQNLLDATPTGYFGSMTSNAVKAFQSNYGIEATGTVGPVTRAQIKSLSCNAKPLTIFSMSPISDTVGTTIKITGSGFGEKNTILIGGGTLTNVPSSLNGTVITFVLPEYINPYCSTGDACATVMKKINSNTTYEISVLNDDRQSNKKTFSVTSKDATTKISSIYKTFGLVGDTVTVTGVGFFSTNTILFGSGVVTNVSSSDGTEMSFKIPTKLYPECFYSTPACTSPVSTTTPGTYEVQVSNVYGISNSKTFTVTSPSISGPSISSISPTSGEKGGSVTISGSGFNAPNLKVKFGSETIENVSSNSGGTKITFIVPSTTRTCDSTSGSMYSAYIPLTDTTNIVCSNTALSLGTYKISVQNANGISKSKKFTLKTSSTSY